MTYNVFGGTLNLAQSTCQKLLTSQLKQVSFRPKFKNCH